MANISKTNDIFFKDEWTLKQYSAFALSLNWAENQYEKMTNSLHYRKIYQHRNQTPYLSGQFSNPTGSKNLLPELRNYFSHYESEWPKEMLKESKLAKELEFLIREAISVLESRKTKLNEDEKKAKQIKKILDEMQEEPLKFFPLEAGNIQPTLALIISLFLTKSQMSFLAGKFFKGKDLSKDSPKHKAQVKTLNTKTYKNITKDPPEHQARVKILETLSQNDRVLIEKGANNENKSFVSPMKETGYAIWGRLETVGLYDNKKDQKILTENEKNKKKAKAGSDDETKEAFPEDTWFMKQLVLYLEYIKALPDVEFARIKTEKEESSNQLTQKIVFEPQNRKDPLQIRHNTIKAEVQLNGQPYKTNFGIHTLKYLVTADLLDIKINDLVTNWLNKHPTRKGKEQKAFGATPKRLEKHIDWRIDKCSKWEKEEIKLYEQIRFICQFLNKAWKEKHKRCMNEREFKDFQQKVRHYRKDYFRKELKGQKLLDISGLGLGQGDEKTLDSMISKGRIQEVFKDMLIAHVAWLEKQREQLSKLSPEQQKELACRLNLRGIEQKRPKDNLRPVAMDFRAVKKEIEKKKEQTESKRFFDHIRELSKSDPPPFSYFGLQKQNEGDKKEGWGTGKNRERWARVGLLLKMIPKLLEEESLKVLNKKPSEKEIEQKLNDKIKIKFKLTQIWRHYAHFKKSKLIRLITVYHKPNFQGVLPLLDISLPKKSSPKGKQRYSQGNNVSVQSLKQQADKERFLLMQALLQWEEEIIKKFNRKRENNKKYISFEEVLKASGIEDTNKEKLKKMRNACMHNDIAEKQFSQVQEPLKKIYTGLEKRDKEKRQNQKKSAIKKRKI